MLGNHCLVWIWLGLPRQLQVKTENIYLFGKKKHGNFLKNWLCPNFSCCPKKLSCPKFGRAAAPTAPPGPYAYDNSCLFSCLGFSKLFFYWLGKQANWVKLISRDELIVCRQLIEIVTAFSFFISDNKVWIDFACASVKMLSSSIFYYQMSCFQTRKKCSESSIPFGNYFRQEIM